MTESDEELRRRGLELQATLPEPSRFAKRWSRRREPSEGRQLLAATLGAAADLGIWGIVLAAPGAVVWLVFRRRAHRASAISARPPT